MVIDELMMNTDSGTRNGVMPQQIPRNVRVTLELGSGWSLENF